MKKAKYDPNHTSAVYRGKSYVTSECITGKLGFWRTEKSFDGAQIAVLFSDTEAAFLHAADVASSTVAVIFVGEVPSELLCDYAVRHELPLLILGKLSHEHNGKIAILDSRTATLFVDPDADTLAHYARHLRFSAQSPLLALSPMLTGSHIAIPFSDSACTQFRHGSMLSAHTYEPLRTVHDEDAWFDAYRALAEEAVGVPLILPVRVYDLNRERGVADLELRLRALLRAAVYGSFSLLFEGLYRAESVRTLFAMLENIGRTLAKEGREYDRSLSCGVAVENCLLLYELAKCPDTLAFVCLDWDRLWQSALPPFAGIMPPEGTKESFLALLKRDTDSLSFPLCARTVHAFAQPWTCADAKQCGLEALFVPAEHRTAWQLANDERKK